MNNSHFINVKSLQGELVFSQKRKGLGCTLTTKEVIFQQPHTTYHILLEDILGMIPFQLKTPRNHIEVIGQTHLVPQFPQNYYKLCAQKAILIKRHGMLERTDTKLIIPLSKRFVNRVARFGNFTGIPTKT